MISYKIFFQLIVVIFKKNLNLQLTLIFYSSFRLALETAFISEQTAENMIGSFLKIRDKSITKLNVC